MEFLHQGDCKIQRSSKLYLKVHTRLASSRRTHLKVQWTWNYSLSLMQRLWTTRSHTLVSRLMGIRDLTLGFHRTMGQSFQGHWSNIVGNFTTTNLMLDTKSRVSIPQDRKSVTGCCPTTTKPYRVDEFHERQNHFIVYWLSKVLLWTI